MARNVKNVVEDNGVVTTGTIVASGSGTFTSIVKSGGTSSQFLKADGSIDSNTYLTTGIASGTYLPLVGGTLTGSLYLPSLIVNTISDGALATTIKRFSATGRAQMQLLSETDVVKWRYGMTGGGSDDFNFFNGTSEILKLKSTGIEVVGTGTFENAQIGAWDTIASWARFGYSTLNNSTAYGHLQENTGRLLSSYATGESWQVRENNDSSKQVEFKSGNLTATGSGTFNGGSIDTSRLHLGTWGTDVTFQQFTNKDAPTDNYGLLMRNTGELYMKGIQLNIDAPLVSITGNLTATGSGTFGGAVQVSSDGIKISGNTYNQFAKYTYEARPTIVGSGSEDTMTVSSVGASTNQVNIKLIRNNGLYVDRNLYVEQNQTVGGTSYLNAVNGTSFVKSGSSDSFVLLGGGGTKAVSDFALATGTYVNKNALEATAFYTIDGSNKALIFNYDTSANVDSIRYNDSDNTYYFNADSVITSSGTGNIRANNMTVGGTLTVDNGTTSIINVVSNDDGISELNLVGDIQGTGRLFVGQSNVTGGGIEYNGDNSPTSTGAGSDYITLYRKNEGTYEWTARNSITTNDWEFRGKVNSVRGDFGELRCGYIKVTGNYTVPSGITTVYIDSTTPRTITLPDYTGQEGRIIIIHAKHTASTVDHVISSNAGDARIYMASYITTSVILNASTSASMIFSASSDGWHVISGGGLAYGW